MRVAKIDRPTYGAADDDDIDAVEAEDNYPEIDLREAADDAIDTSAAAAAWLVDSWVEESAEWEWVLARIRSIILNHTHSAALKRISLSYIVSGIGLRSTHPNSSARHDIQ